MEMWDLTVAEAHTFFVGDGQTLVHNCPLNNNSKELRDKIARWAQNNDKTPSPSTTKQLVPVGNSGLPNDISLSKECFHRGACGSFARDFSIELTNRGIKHNVLRYEIPTGWIKRNGQELAGSNDAAQPAFHAFVEVITQNGTFVFDNTVSRWSGPWLRQNFDNSLSFYNINRHLLDRPTPLDGLPNNY